MSITIYATPGQPAEGWLTEPFKDADLNPDWVEASKGSEGQSRIQGLGYHSVPVPIVQYEDQLSSWDGLCPAKVAAAIHVEQGAVHAARAARTRPQRAVAA